MIALETEYNQNGLATTTISLSKNDLIAFQNALGTELILPEGKTTANIVSVTLGVDVNGNSNLQVITN